jgi:hypothetical protein
MRTVRSLPRILTATALLAGACTRHEIAPSFDTIVSSTEEREGNPPTHVLYVENHSTTPVTVYSAGITECDNVDDPCTAHSMNLRVGPGEKQIVLRITPADPSRGFSYRFAHSWRAGALDRTAVSAPAGSPNLRAQQREAIQRRGDSVRTAEAAAGYTFLGREDYTPLAGRVAALRVVGDSIVLAAGQTGKIDDLRFVLVDAEGRVLGSTLWVRWNAPAGRTVQFLSGREFVGRTPGRALLIVALEAEAQRMLGQTVSDLAVPIVVVDSAAGRQQ